eukprot:GFKZ01011447.1.p1 GENE.GFKZ01011447.1~~GFKZ01011447.1.p1  ORF type:complete len:118 (-),score=4.35 GFKZ01011447.1:734-1087(-)
MDTIGWDAVEIVKIPEWIVWGSALSTDGRSTEGGDWRYEEGLPRRQPLGRKALSKGRYNLLCASSDCSCSMSDEATEGGRPGCSEEIQARKRGRRFYGHGRRLVAGLARRSRGTIIL